MGETTNIVFFILGDLRKSWQNIHPCLAARGTEDWVPGVSAAGVVVEVLLVPELGHVLAEQRGQTEAELASTSDVH